MNHWTDFFIKRPVFSIALTLCIVFVGLFAVKQLPLQMYPTIEIPVVKISAFFPGANAQAVKNFVTSPIENVLSGIKGVDFIKSTTSQGNASVSVRMNLGVDASSAMTDISQKISSIRGQLPESMHDPIISKADASENPIMVFSFTNPNWKAQQISDYVTRIVKPQLESADGVAQAQVLGPRYAMKLQLNPEALAAHHLSPQDVGNALNQESILAAPGSINGAVESLNLSADTTFNDAKAFNQLVIKSDGNTAVHLNDIGKAWLGSDTDTISAYYRGQRAVMTFIAPQPGANPLSISNQINRMLPSIKQGFPAGLQMHEVIDFATFIRASLKEVIMTMIEAVLIVALVIFLFLGSLRAVLIPFVTIPVSLIGILFILWITHCSLNMLTLLAMVIAIGLVVDDAIVVMENIFRHIEAGEPPLSAAFKGTREIAFSIIAMTLTLAALFAPIGFSSGLTGKLFTEFAISLAGCVIISGIIALTLSPMMCSRVINQSYLHHRFVQLIDRTFDSIRHFYHSLLLKILKHKKIILCVWALSLIGCVYCYLTTPQELAPKEDMGFMMVIGDAPNATSSQLLKSYTQSLNQAYKPFPEIKGYVYINGLPSISQVMSFILLKPWQDRKLSSMQLQPLIQNQLNNIPGLKLVSIVPSGLPGASSMPVKFVLRSINSYLDLYKAAKTIESQANNSHLFTYLSNDLSYDQPVLKLHVDRNAANAVHVSVADIMSTLSEYLGQENLQYFSIKGQTYNVIPEAESDRTISPSILKTIQIQNEQGHFIPLSSVVTWSTEVEPSSLNRFQKFNSVTLSGSIAPGYSLSQGLNYLAKITRQNFPKTISIDYSGNSRQFIQEGNRMLWIYLAAFIAIFLLLSMQFESFRDPLIILLGSVPMATLSALLPMKLGVATINIYTQIGLLTLAGLISKHGILLVKFANVRCEEGYSTIDAIVSAAQIRLRPILMTTLAVVFGALPLILSDGPGQSARFDIGVVIASGMLVGTVFTLFVVPVLYSYISKEK